MSSFKSSINRKRRNYCESSDSDSDDGVKSKKGSKDLSKFSSRLQQLMGWVAKLNVNKYFLRSMERGSSVTVIDDDDDEIKEVDDDEVVVLKEVKTRGKQNPFYNRTKSRHAFINGCRRRSPRLSDSFICATNGFTNLSLSSTKISRNGVCKNGFYEENSDPYVTDKTTNGVSKSSKPKVLSPITNPETDIQILLDTHRKSTSDADDIVLLAECSDSELSAAQSRRTMRTRSSSNIRDCSISKSKMCHEKNQETGRIPDPASCIRNPFTAFEVIRLNEKKQYQELLDKYMKNQFYQPLKKPAVVDVESESSNELVNLEHCNKEVLQQPLDSYLQQYYEPFKISKESTEKPKEQQEPDVEVTKDEVLEIDDDVEVNDRPTFKLKYARNPDFANPEWLSQLRYQVREQAAERQKLEDNQLKKLDELRKKRLKEEILKSIEPWNEQARKSVEIPKITPEMIVIINRALCQPLDFKVAQSKNASLMRRDIETLVGLNWLNDEVINYYLSLIVERSEKNKNYPKVYAYNTFFYSTLKNKGYTSVKRWTRKVDVFSYDILLVPLHLDIHWALAVIYPAKKKIEYYDSMSSGELSCFAVLSDYMVSELKDKKGQVETSEYYLEKMIAPIQMNGSDCGMFTLKYAEYISRNANMNFDQANIPYFRERMIYELLTNKLL